MKANDNARPLPTPEEFCRLLAEFVSAHDHALQAQTQDEFLAAEAMRMQLIESYERAYRRP